LVLKPILQVKGLKKSFLDGSFELEIFRNVHFEIYPGDFISLSGPSGSGKTTLLHLIAGLDKPNKGEIILDGNNLSQMKNKELTSLRLEKVGYIFQFFNLLPEFTALENTALPLLIKRVKKKLAEEKAKSLLLEMGLEKQLNQKVFNLSGGEQQRIAIARALVNEPALLLADEPLGNLDLENKKIVQKILWEINKKKKKTIILATHNETLAAQADRQLKIVEREIVEV
jgi:ABC-type lipoprotein export system ATPase subunit